MKSRVVFYHILFWLGIYLLWVFAFHSYAISLTKTLTVEFCYLIFITAAYYTIGDFLLPQFLHKKRYASFVAMTIAITAFAAWLRALVAVQAGRYLFHEARQTDFATLYASSFLNIFFWVMLITAAKMLMDMIGKHKELERLEQEKIKSELDFLKAQINPHALFNSLNTIYGHIDKKNQQARNILLQFSELLRYQLYDCAAEKITLQKEIDFIRNYVAFQKLRKDGNLLVSIDIPDFENDWPIAPLLIIVLIENAFKFASQSINIQFRLEAGKLIVAVENSIEPHPATEKPSGIGLINLRRRLELLYPGQHELTITQEPESYRTNLTLILK